MQIKFRLMIFITIIKEISLKISVIGADESYCKANILFEIRIDWNMRFRNWEQWFMFDYSQIKSVGL